MTAAGQPWKTLTSLHLQTQVPLSLKRSNWHCSGWTRDARMRRLSQVLSMKTWAGWNCPESWTLLHGLLNSQHEGWIPRTLRAKNQHHKPQCLCAFCLWTQEWIGAQFRFNSAFYMTNPKYKEGKIKDRQQEVGKEVFCIWEENQETLEGERKGSERGYKKNEVMTCTCISHLQWMGSLCATC